MNEPQVCEYCNRPLSPLRGMFGSEAMPEVCDSCWMEYIGLGLADLGWDS